MDFFQLTDRYRDTVSIEAQHYEPDPQGEAEDGHIYIGVEPLDGNETQVSLSIEEATAYADALHRAIIYAETGKKIE